MRYNETFISHSHLFSASNKTSFVRKISHLSRNRCSLCFQTKSSKYFKYLQYILYKRSKSKMTFSSIFPASERLHNLFQMHVMQPHFLCPGPVKPEAAQKQSSGENSPQKQSCESGLLPCPALCDVSFEKVVSRQSATSRCYNYDVAGLFNISYAYCVQKHEFQAHPSYDSSSFIICFVIVYHVLLHSLGFFSLKHFSQFC